MLTIDHGPASPACDRIGRRNLLQAGLLGIGGLIAPGTTGTTRGADVYDFVKDKAVVLLFLAGGPSQYETFDPKPDAIGNFTSIAGHIATRLPGVRFASYFPRLAERADKLTILRSLTAKTANHAKAAKNLLTGGFEDVNGKEGAPAIYPSMGAALAQARGANDPRTGMPTYAVVPPVFDPVPGLKISSVNPGVESVTLGSGGGTLGSAFAPFNPAGSGGWIELMTPKLPAVRLDGRRDLLAQLDQLGRRLDQESTFRDVDRLNQQAYDALRGGAIRRALDLSQEDPCLVARYDTSHCPIYAWSKENRWVTDGPSTGFPLGRQMLLARRLCEAGCRFVTVTHSNWDMHGGEAIWGIKPGMDLFAPPLDHAASVFVDDLESRGLLDQVLLVIVGEFGRTGSINKNAGRDHNAGTCPAILAGGGLRHGQVIGATNRNGTRSEEDVLSVDDLCATLMHYLFDVGKLRIRRAASPQLQALAVDHGQPIRQLF
jgi:hypothetical protein